MGRRCSQPAEPPQTSRLPLPDYQGGVSSLRPNDERSGEEFGRWWPAPGEPLPIAHRTCALVVAELLRMLCSVSPSACAQRFCVVFGNRGQSGFTEKRVCASAAITHADTQLPCPLLRCHLLAGFSTCRGLGFGGSWLAPMTTSVGRQGPAKLIVGEVVTTCAPNAGVSLLAARSGHCKVAGAWSVLRCCSLPRCLRRLTFGSRNQRHICTLGRCQRHA